jgi:hypothetical protein
LQLPVWHTEMLCLWAFGTWNAHEQNNPTISTWGWVSRFEMGPHVWASWSQWMILNWPSSMGDGHAIGYHRYPIHPNDMFFPFLKMTTMRIFLRKTILPCKLYKIYICTEESCPSNTSILHGHYSLGGVSHDIQGTHSQIHSDYEGLGSIRSERGR